MEPATTIDTVEVPTPEELARRRQVAAKVLEQRKVLKLPSGMSVVDLLREDRDASGPSV